MEPLRPRAILREAPILGSIEIAPIERARYLELSSVEDRDAAGRVYDRLFLGKDSGNRFEREGLETATAEEESSDGKDLLEQLLGDALLEESPDDNDAHETENVTDIAPSVKIRATRGPPRPRAVVADTSDATRRKMTISEPMRPEVKTTRESAHDQFDKVPRRVTRSRSAASAAATTAKTLEDKPRAAKGRASSQAVPFLFTSIMTPEMKRDDALSIALAELKYESWSHLVETLIRRAGGHEALAERNAKRDRETKLEIKDRNIVLEDVFNRNGLLHDEKFARAYRAASKGLKEHLQVVDDAIALERHSKLTNVWSSISPEDHSWYLTHQHMKLSGQEAKFLAALSERVKKEQQAYQVEIHRLYDEDQHRFKYDHLTDRQAGQLQSDDERRQARVCALFPTNQALAFAGSFSLDFSVELGDGVTTTTTSLIESAGAVPTTSTHETKTSFQFISVLRELGTPDELSELAPGHDLQGHKHYLPPIGPPSNEVFTKPEVAEIDQDPVVPELLDELAAVEPGKNSQRVAGTDASTITLVTTASTLHKMMAIDSMSRTTLDPPGTLDVPITKQGNTWYLHKPCMPRKLMVREKQRRLQKYAVLSESCALPRPEEKRTIYTLWQHSATGTRIIVRHRSVFRMAATPVLFAVKPEYLPPPDREQLTPQETAIWNARLSLSAPLGARAMQLAHVNIATGKVLSWEAYHAPRDTSNERRGLFTVNCPSIAGLLAWIERIGSRTSVPSSSRLASVVAGSHWDMYTAAEGFDVDKTRLFNIRETHENSTATDVVSKPFVPPIWRRFSDDVAQIPNTFPPRRKAEKQAHLVLTNTLNGLTSSPNKGPKKRGGKKRKAKKGTHGANKVVAVPDDLDDVQAIPAPTCQLDYDDL